MNLLYKLLLGLSLLTLFGGGLWVALRLVRRPKPRICRHCGYEMPEGDSEDKCLLAPREWSQQLSVPGRVLRFKGPLVHDTFARADDGTLWRWDGTRWVEHIEDLPTPNERPGGRR